MQIPATIEIATVPNMQSLPQSVKDEFIRRKLPNINYKNQMAIALPDNTICGWAPSVSDTLADDWTVLD